MTFSLTVIPCRLVEIVELIILVVPCLTKALFKFVDLLAALLAPDAPDMEPEQGAGQDVRHFTQIEHMRITCFTRVSMADSRSDSY